MCEFFNQHERQTIGNGRAERAPKKESQVKRMKIKCDE